MLVGDSMNRNQFESILCLLREGLSERSGMFEIHGYKITKGRGYFVFKFTVILIVQFYVVFRSRLNEFFWGPKWKGLILVTHLLHSQGVVVIM